ncbi:DUF1616 domain-containing protein [Halococcus sp. IIIV-5B]|uniref:DUF1616 domain-containing protein n=1 Tax=Halococcus sp. IIIV-5B TaxID=2321230 RepID=UPI000E7422EA|nr:DUF1616 domain-containing protein [Halococcus sp. IIIV-5B]RJS97631.1 DUF1616 domain-containing protein [Halococcus sp. IIIV-5B]
MSSESDAWLLVPRPLRRLPVDLVVVALLVVLTAVSALVPPISGTPIRIVLGLPFVLFLPGYAFVAALFPEAGRTADPTEDDESEDRIERAREDGIDGIERVALSFGLSIAVSPLIGLALNFTPFGIRLVPIVVAIGGFTLVAVAVAAARRLALPAADRFRIPLGRWYAATRTEMFDPETRMDQVLNVVLAVSLLLAVSSVAYAVATPTAGESFSEFYLLTENETGALTAENYPENFTEGAGQPLVVGVSNHEHRPTNYTVVAQLQRVRVANNTTRVLERSPIQRFSPRLADNETWTRRHTVTPTMTGDRLRLTYLLYRGPAPANPTTGNAYRETHLWVNVTS